MKLFSSKTRASCRGSVLVLVLWVALGVVSLTLYFAHTMSFELRASDNRVAAAAADGAIEGALAYVGSVLDNLDEAGKAPEIETYESEEVPIGESLFWLIGREEDLRSRNRPYFGLVDEASKLNLSTATAEMLEMLPGMTAELAAAIVDWRDTDSDPSPNGAESDVYGRLRPAYRCKNGPFESLGELRLVNGMTLELLFGEDLNLNGILDANENDGDASLPYDNRDGRLDPGLFEYVTIWSREPNTRSDGSPKININTAGREELLSLLQQNLGAARADEIIMALRTGGNVTSLLEFFVRSGMTAEEFAEIASDITATTESFRDGLINVNTASEQVLACIPGVGTEKAGSLVAYRQANRGKLGSIAWVAEVLDVASIVQAGRFITTQSYQFTADVAALGPFGRGYRRVRAVFDTSDGSAKMVYRQDFSLSGWALGSYVREQLELTRLKR